MKCPNCGAPRDISAYDCDACGWEFGFEGGGLDDDDGDGLYDFCPKCGKDYDEIDYEYQICHICKHKA